MRNLMTKKINLKDKLFLIILIIAIALFFQPAYIGYSNLSGIAFIYLNGIRVVFVIALIKYLVNAKISKYMLILIIYFLIRLVTTIINGNSINAFITEAYPILAICILIELCMKKKTLILIEGFTITLNTLLVINFITLIINPIGYGTEYDKFYFLRGGNQLMAFCVLATMFSFINWYLKKSAINKFMLWMIIGMSTYTAICIKSATGILTWAIIITFLCVPQKLKNKKLFNFSTYSLTYLSIFIFIVILNGQQYFSYIIETILNKSMTFSGRTDIWQIALEKVKIRPILGYGISNNSNIIYYREQYFSTHNEFLQILVESGLIGFIPLILIYIIIGKKLMKYKEDICISVIAISILALATSLFAESMGMFDMFIVLTIACYSEKILQFNSVRLYKEKEYDT